MLQRFHHQVGRFSWLPTVNVVSTALLVSCLFLQEIHSQKLTVLPVGDQYDLSLDGFDYQQKNLDIIWNISYPAEIKISRFDVDTVAGDFLVICQYPLPNDDRLSTGSAAEDVIHLLPVENSLLLSPEVLPPQQDGNPESNDMIIRISSHYGAFIYFHGVISKDEMINPYESLRNSSANATLTEGRLDFQNKTTGDKDGRGTLDSVQALKTSGQASDQKHMFEGFHIRINFFELNPTTVIPSTTEKLTTPAPGVGIYIKKHVLGKTPGEFYRDLETFKKVIADMGNAYCQEIYDCSLPYPINATNDVRLTKEMIFFCERSLPYYSTCVQVQFAITIRSILGTYVMTSDRLEVMWATYAQMNLTNLGLEPYEPPTVDAPITTWIWAAAALGSILALSSILCFALVGNNIFQTSSSERNHGVIKPINYEDMQTAGNHSGSTSDFGDKDSPIWKMLQTNMIMERQLHDEESYGMHDLDREVAERNRRALLPLNELRTQSGHFNEAFDADEEDVHWSLPAAEFRESPQIQHNLAVTIRHPSTDEDSDEAIELHNQF